MGYSHLPVLICVLGSGLVLAQDARESPDPETVREGIPPIITPVPAGEQPSVSLPTEPSESLQTLYRQLTELQQEMMRLRGILEENKDRLRTIQEEHKRRYLELDRRLQKVAVSGDRDGGGDSLPDGATVTDPEQRDYQEAYTLLRDKAYNEAIEAFEQLLFAYPNGQHVADSLYWLGEIYLNLPVPNPEKSRQMFVQIIDFYPQYRKVPEALYKMGVIYHQLGDRDMAQQRLRQVVEQYPGTPSARLAAGYMRDNLQ